MSSWSIGLALTHHFVVWIAANRAGILNKVLQNPKGFYGIVGDDLFIAHPQLAFQYSILMNAIGVKINLNKSLLVSEDARVSEFVKRNSFRGDEITALSPKLIVKSFTDYVCLRELLLYIRHRTLSESGMDRASSPDEKGIVDLYTVFGSKFIRTAIGTMCTVPTIYAGLSEDTSEMAQWPPSLRIRFLVEKALTLLEYSMHSTYISGTGQDVYNELVLWSLEDLVPQSYFSQTPFMDYLRKQTLEAHRLFSGVDIEQNQLMAQLALKAYEISLGEVSLESYLRWEEDYLKRLSSFAKPDRFQAIEAERKETRSLSFKVYEIIRKSKLSAPTEQFVRGRINHRLKHLLSKFNFELPTNSSLEEMYASLFGECEENSAS
jgi:hypothetical protein